MKLPIKVMLCYLMTVLVIFTTVNLIGNSLLGSRSRQNVREEYSGHAVLLAEQYASYLERPDMDTEHVRELLKASATLIGARIWLVNSNAIVIIDTGSDNQIDLSSETEDVLSSEYTENVTAEGLFTEPMLMVTEPVLGGYTTRGYVCILVPMTVSEKMALEYMNTVNRALILVSIALAAAFVCVYMIVAHPIGRLGKAAIEYAKGNYDYKLNLRRQDEFGELADAVNYMVGEIKSVDDYQKKFIANISHDFRSPLTSIKGYAEAMKDGTIPQDAQDKYFDIILFETDRLSKLTSNLLDLNRIDSKGLILDITSFDINTMIKKTAATFEGICRQKKITLELQLASGEIYVDADMSRIQQVIYNLTDNAVKFSDTGSRVEIETEEKGSKALVRVRDHGAGIPKESIKKIWDRFYKTDASRGKDKKGTGLGLSIVKEVISAHDENINVISTEGVGTEFTFTLALTEA